MAKKSWSQMTQDERDAANRRSERIVKVIAALIVGLILVAILTVTFGVRRYAPCWIFPLKEAPTRCLPGAVP